MEITKRKNYLLIEDTQESITDFASRLTKNHHQFENENVVIDILKYKEIQEQELLGFLELSSVHYNNKKSFVIATDVFDIDTLPDELTIAPSLREAEDIIQMEELERNLGF
ncbi:ribonuclease Z [Zunongwangia sp.]|uniref:ribonuclease Z n=1 Tax=Zunongwangia sp. TaxID=1965325 RepID=UPI003AA90BFF